MSMGILLNPDTVRTLGFASMGASYAAVGTELSNPIRIFYIQNFTDAHLMFSFNGTDDHFPIATNSFFLLDIASNKTSERGFFLSAGHRLFVKEIGTPTTGSVYFTAFYGSDNHIT